MTVDEIMTPDPIAVETTVSLRKAMQTLTDNDIRHLPVVDAGTLVGMLSDRDFRELSFDPLNDDPDEVASQMQQPVSLLMSGDVLSVDTGTDLSEVIDLMIDQKIGAVPIVDNTRSLVGIVSYVDVLAAIREQL